MAYSYSTGSSHLPGLPPPSPTIPSWAWRLSQRSPSLLFRTPNWTVIVIRRPRRQAQSLRLRISRCTDTRKVSLELNQINKVLYSVIKYYCFINIQPISKSWTRSPTYSIDVEGSKEGPYYITLLNLFWVSLHIYIFHIKVYKLIGWEFLKSQVDPVNAGWPKITYKRII